MQRVKMKCCSPERSARLALLFGRSPHRGEDVGSYEELLARIRAALQHRRY